MHVSAQSKQPRPLEVVADKPTSMLDVSIRMGILNLLSKLKPYRDLAILLITHHGCPFTSRCPEALDLCRRVDPSAREVNGPLVRCHLYSEATGGEGK